MKIRTNRNMIAELQQHDLDLLIVFHDGEGIAVPLADIGIDGTCGDGSSEQPDECLRVQLCSADENDEEEFESSAQAKQTVAEMVRQFHENYNCPIGSAPGLPANPALREMRENILLEEFQEYTRAESEGDLIEVADALADIVYIAYGTALTYGIPLDNVLAEVQRSNMSKLGADGKPIFRADGKVMKGPEYFKPDIAGVLERVK